ncbi:RNA-binding protein [Panacibacter ginsenosidivorans]|uniref:RNA-binding protein n=1 Tax=Panacibacter ginsenosidivorans TaxID=1813871 RepID=A0A5B8VAH8_9BACT|nr:VCBS repeat-containing protein [Panacibacter ginsenosidivorans]QEC67308.1 RNA-binding protein [Panacibacter ginsenosidivorans]
MKCLYKVCLFLVMVFVCAVSKAQQTLFQLLSPKETNVKFVNEISETENLNVLAYEYFYNGAGVAVGDINGDGLEDIFFTANMKPNKLFLNLGGMKFKDITKEAGVEGRNNAWKTGVTMADVNGDGLLDIYVCYSGKVSDDQRRNQLFINKGNLKFSEEAKQFGLDDKSYSTQAAFFDYDNDGDLDMFLLNHSTKKIDNMELARYRNDVDSLSGNKLYENQNNHFADVSGKCGIRRNPLTFGLGIAVADVNKDGWQDIYVSNDYNEPDYLYINNHDGTFKEESQQCLTHLSQFSMGVDIVDFNNDALPDIMTLDMLPEDNRRQKLLQLQENYESFQLMQSQELYKQYMRNMLHLNNGDGTFSEIAQASGVSNTDWSWSPLFADFDNDGYKDLFITNGYLRDYTNKDFLRYWGDYKIKKAMDREPSKMMDLVTAMPSTTLYNYIFKNNHDLTFSNMKNDWGMTESGISSGAVYADLDNDGDLDLVVNHINSNAAVYQNMEEDQKKAAYLSVKLKYKGANINAVGSKIYVYSNGTTQYEEVNPNRGYLSCMSTIQHFGLGDNPKIDSVKIIWPDNTAQLLTNVTANQKIAIEYKDTKPSINSNAVAATIFSKTKNIINYKNESFDENDFKRQQLMMFMYSKTGPVTAQADVNKDGLEDVFISGDRNKPGALYLQQKDGNFTAVKGLNIGDENISATSAATFADVNNDGFVDLYVAKGGYSLFQPNTAALQDELYMNDGKGNFVLSTDALPDVSASSKSCVRACDYDNDGDIDFFVGGRVVPGRYPMTPVSYLLSNDGKGKFTIVNTSFSDIGMVTDAQWADLNNDGTKDLVLCGEFMPVSVFINTTNGFVDKTNEYFTKPDNGLWFSLNIADVDGDGRQDIIAGNVGRNTQIHFSEKEPAELYFADFDGNGSIDPFLNCYVEGTSYPFVSRDELNEQIYPMRKKFTSYKDYSTATMKDIFSADDMAKAGKLTATECNTVCYLNRNGKFEKIMLPLEAQFSVVTKVIVNDFDKDGKQDLLLLGNRSDNRLKIGAIDANYGCLLKGDGRGNFAYVAQTQSGLSVKGDVKSAEVITVNNEKYLLIGVADGPMQFYKMQ